MKNNFAALIVGFIFALGLGLSGMTQPQKIIGFLDVFGNWDPSLIFVMMGAILVHSGLYFLIRRRSAPLFAHKWHVPESREITVSLVAGSLIFGIGWGMAGYCPGPAVTSLGSFELRPFVFVGAMIIGMIVFRVVNTKVKFKR